MSFHVMSSNSFGARARSAANTSQIITEPPLMSWVPGPKMRSPSGCQRKLLRISSSGGKTVSRWETRAMLLSVRPRRVSTRWSPHARLYEGTHSALNPKGAKHSAVNRLSRFTPSRLPVKLLMSTIWRNISSAAGIWLPRNSFSGPMSCIA